MKHVSTLALVACLSLGSGTALAQDVLLAAPVTNGFASSSDAPSPEAVPESAAMAQIRQNGCVALSARASDAQISTFLERPASLLSDFGMTSVEMSARVRALVGSDARALGAAVSLLSAASVDQRSAIGSGLGRAAFACQEVNPEYAAAIQSWVAELEFADVKTAFLAATNDIQVAAIAAASGASGGGGAPGLSGGGVAGPGTAGLQGDATVPTQSGVYAVGNSSGVSFVEGGGGQLSIVLITGSPFSIE